MIVDKGMWREDTVVANDITGGIVIKARYNA